MRCSICEEKPAVLECRVCRRMVCGDDYVREKRVCSACQDALCQICNKYLSIGYCSICGRMGCEDCLVKVSPVSYICRHCISKLGYEV
ncbi:MAG: hypothetical protein DRO13_00595 [Thermoprotei archaeon]|nr:MAG: hypothetical protein DRO13_00595 [Thermoprotei archaeon]